MKYDIIQNFKVCSYRDFIDLSLLRGDPADGFKTVLLFFLVTFGAIFDVIF